MTTSYALIEKVRKAISTDYVQASDARVAKALFISRATISAYKKGTMIMNPQTLDRAAELCQWPRDDIAEYFLALSQDAVPQAKLVWEAQNYMLQQAKNYGTLATNGAVNSSDSGRKSARRGAKVAALLLATGAGIAGFSAPSPTQASTNDATNTVYYV